MRRTVAGILAILLVVSLGSQPAVAAQDATPGPASPFADLELPTLDIIAAPDGLEGFPEQLEAGRYHVRLTVSEDVEGGSGFELIQPTGMTVDEFLAWAANSEGGAPPEGATPAADAPQDPFFTANLAGGASGGSGQTVEVVLDLTPGEWLVLGPAAEPIVFEATGQMPADLPEPESTATLTMGEYVIEVTEGELTTGSYVVRVDNIGAQPHFVGWYQGPDGFTAEQVETLLDEEAEAQMTGTPAAYSSLDPNVDLASVIATGNQSTGTSQWIYVQDVEAGTHLLICFVMDISDGRPHAYHGMYNIVEVE